MGYSILQQCQPATHNMLYSLIYISKAVAQLTSDELSCLLIKAQEHNKAACLTGMLMYVYSHTNGSAEGRFMQVLEGNKENVTTLFSRIKADSRHYDVLIVDEGEIPQRIFKNWTMGFKPLQAETTDNLPDYLNLDDYHTVDKHLSGLNKPINYLKSFYQINLKLSY